MLKRLLSLLSTPARDAPPEPVIHPDVPAAATLPRCPYCDHDLGKMPKRWLDCPACHQRIRLKRAPGTDEARLVTVEQAEDIESAWNERAALNDLRRMLKSLDLDDAEIEHALSSSKDPKTVFKKVLMDIATNSGNRYQQRKMAYLQLARHAFGEKKQYLSYERAGMRCELLDLYESGQSQVRIVSLDDACGYCSEAGGEVYSLESEIETVHLPHAACTRDADGSGRAWCRCYYEIV